LQPIRPFWCRVDLKEDLGRELYWRTADGTWAGGESEAKQYFERSGPTGVGLQLVRDIEGVSVGKRSERAERKGLKESTRAFRERVLEKEDLKKEVAKLEESIQGLAESFEKARAECACDPEWKAYKRTLNLEDPNLFKLISVEATSAPAGGSGDEMSEGLQRRVAELHRIVRRRRLQKKALELASERLKESEEYEELDRLSGAICVALVEPQQALEGILSGDWGHGGEPPGDRPAFFIRQDTIGHEGTRRQFEKDNELERFDKYWRLGPTGPTNQYRREAPAQKSRPRKRRTR